MMLRHFYNFDYDIYKELPHGRRDTNFHMSVFVTAKKYLVERLHQLALNAISIAANSTLSNADPRIKKNIPALFEAIKVLDAHRDQHEYFAQLSAKLTKAHLEDLITLPDFRQTLEEEENKHTLEFVIKAVKAVKKEPSFLDEGKSECSIVTCRQCAYKWVEWYSVVSPGCRELNMLNRNVTRWRQL